MTGYEAAGRFFYRRYMEDGLESDDPWTVAAIDGIMINLCRETVDWDEGSDQLRLTAKGEFELIEVAGNA